MKTIYIFITSLCVMMCGNAQDSNAKYKSYIQTVFSKDSLVKIQNYINNEGYADSIQIYNRNKKIVLSSELKFLPSPDINLNFLDTSADTTFISDYKYQQLSIPSKIDDFKYISKDIIVLRGGHTINHGGALGHLIFFSLRTNTIIKWMTYVAGQKDTRTTSFIYQEESQTILMPRNINDMNFLNYAYMIDHSKKTFRIIKPIQKPISYIVDDLGKLSEEERFFYEIKLNK